jgi:hypothetical protein
MADDYKTITHFVGFRDDRYWNAVAVFGLPDMIHHDWDFRAQSDFAPGDTVVFANDKDWTRFQTNQPTPYSYNDSENF